MAGADTRACTSRMTVSDAFSIKLSALIPASTALAVQAPFDMHHNLHSRACGVPNRFGWHCQLT